VSQGQEAAGGGPQTVSRPPEDLEAPQEPSAGPPLLAVLEPGAVATARAAIPPTKDRATLGARVAIAGDPEAGQPVDAGGKDLAVCNRKNLAVCNHTSPSNDVETHSAHSPQPLPEIIKHQQPAAGALAGVSTPQAQEATP